MHETSDICLGSCSTPASSTETAGGKQHLAILQQLIRLTTSAVCFCTINETSKRKAAKRQAVPRFKVLQQLDKADHIITYVQENSSYNVTLKRQLVKSSI
ncbi:Glutamine--tRNA ligase protein virJ [Frankliniella fusca]|uniref:Glutamine--tRNA ligase protein virJ n=1 Tax=Frankliniella fusca TaxID=407009 RepID=A0AAE1LSQ9_9NEOP|nr:Glutamine--tRNA ligase protein virJ [Frankliniella fusca]